MTTLLPTTRLPLRERGRHDDADRHEHRPTRQRAGAWSSLALACACAWAALAACAPAADAHAAALSVVSPRRAVPVPQGDTTVIVGTVEHDGGIGRVAVAVRDLKTRLWLRQDGSWGKRQFHTATLHDGGATTADWSFAFDAPDTGRYRVVARGYDRADARLGIRASKRFRITRRDAPPPLEGDLGEFVAFCPASHRLRDDPIVFPGLPGQSHLHSFFGSTAADAFATLGPMLDGDTTCDPSVDRSAYWVPTLVENGVALEPEQATFYYLTANDDPGSIRPFPPGLRILAGTPTRAGPDGPSRYKWSCRGAGDSSTGDFVACPAGHELELLLDFPDCWNGTDLDAADHKSHLAYSAGGACPASHPVPVPRLQFKLRYPTSGGPGVRIATGSGAHASHGGNGYSAHGDFFNAWLPGTLEARVERCLWRAVKCDPDGEALE